MSSPEHSPMSDGRVLAGRYPVGEVIGRGGMADVRVGHDIRTGRSVAIRALRSTVAEDPLVRSSLRREAQLLRRVRHHAIVALVDVGHAEGLGPGGRAGRSLPRPGAPVAAYAVVPSWLEDFRADTEAVRAAGLPTLILRHGRQDLPVDLTARRFRELIPDAAYAEVDGAPHGLLWTHADEVDEGAAAPRHQLSGR